MVREKLRYLRDLTQQIQDMASANGVKKADDVEFFSAKEMNGALGPAGAIWSQRDNERRELADFLGVVYLRGQRTRTAGASLVVY